MIDLKALKVSLTLINLFNSGRAERRAVEDILERMRFKELKTFSYKNLKWFHEMNLERKIPNNYFPITPENTLAQEILFYLEYLEEHTIYIPEDWGKPDKDDPHSQYTLTQLRALATGDSISDRASDCK